MATTGRDRLFYLPVSTLNFQTSGLAKLFTWSESAQSHIKKVFVHMWIVHFIAVIQAPITHVCKTIKWSTPHSLVFSS
jgi:hypothetical protein